MARPVPATRTAPPLALALAALALVAALALTRAATAPAATDCTPSASWGTNRPDLASQVVALVNAHRASLGIGALSTVDALEASSVWKSLHMAGNGYFSHDDPAPPVARSAYQRARDCGYGGGTWGENIAAGYGSAQAVMSGWLNSAGHRANIENASFTAIGVGVAQSTGGTLYWTQSFGVGAAPPPPPPSPPPPPPPAPPPPPPPPPPPASSPPPPASPPPAPPAAAPSPPATGPASPPSARTSAPPAATGVPSAKAPAVGALRAKVSRARAGAKLRARVAFVHLETRRRVVEGSVRCRALVGGKRLRVVENAFVGGLASCAWRVPASARGRTLTGIVAVQIGDEAARRVFVRRLT